MVPPTFRKRPRPQSTSTTPRPSARSRLRVSDSDRQARLDLIRLGTSDGSWEVQVRGPDVTAAGNPLCWSAPLHRLLGFTTPADVPNVLSSWSSRLHPDDYVATVAAFRKHLEDRSGATPYDVVYRLRCRDGDYRWFRAVGHTQRGAGGRPLRCAGTLTDITDARAVANVKRYAETLLDNLPVGMVVLDAGLRVRSVNRAFIAICRARTQTEFHGRDITEVLPLPGLRERALAFFDEGGTRHGVELTLRSRHLRVAVTKIDLEDGSHGLLAVVEDVTADRHLREEARQLAARHRDQASLLDEARDAIIVRDLDGIVQYWNKGAERMYGWTAGEAVGQHVLGMLYATGDAPLAALAAVRTDGHWTGELAQRRRDGSALTAQGHWTLVRDPEGRPTSIFTINTDISERKATEARIRKLALYDTLTGLPNRTLLADRFADALARAGLSGAGLVVLFMDLNRFKEINDTKGHLAGDEVLVEVARRFRGVLREGETLARLSGDEFVVLAETTATDAGPQIATRLRRTLDEPVECRASTFAVSVSIGIATYPADGATMEDLIRHADIAMYRAKHAGGGHVVYRPEMGAGVAERMELARDLGRAMQANALELHFQPQVDIASGQLVGAEALLRWHDPVRGWVSPGVFVPIAESRGMISSIGAWVLREACARLRAWRDAGLVFSGRLSINLAVQQLEDPDLVDTMCAVVADAGLRPSNIGLELTESGLMTNVANALSALERLRDAGFSIAIDDFGTGYSSLAYLKQVPANKLKIDISFVRDMLVDTHDHTIVTTIIGMARNLGMGVIAEGVEQPEQAAALAALGCAHAQGFLFGRPQPAEAFAARWLALPPASTTCAPAAT